MNQEPEAEEPEAEEPERQYEQDINVLKLIKEVFDIKAKRLAQEHYEKRNFIIERFVTEMRTLNQEGETVLEPGMSGEKETEDAGSLAWEKRVKEQWKELYDNPEKMDFDLGQKVWNEEQKTATIETWKYQLSRLLDKLKLSRVISTDEQWGRFWHDSYLGPNIGNIHTFGKGFYMPTCDDNWEMWFDNRATWDEED
eukprot:SAG11_NODE_10039_length_861_cov_1.447507_1_plen_197_part_00